MAGVCVTIRVKVELMPTLRRLREEKNFDLKLPDDATVGAALEKLGFKEDEMEHLRVFVNNKWARLDRTLKDGDDMWVGVVVGGGTSWDFTTRKPLERCK